MTGPAGRALPSTAEAVAASVACARAVGLPADDPHVVAEGYSVRVLLRPAPVVTRVLTVGQSLRGDPRPWLAREVAVASFLAAGGAPVGAPWSDPGPHRAGGLDVTLWDWVEHEPGVVPDATFGALLGRLHEALTSYDAELPPLVGPLTDIASGLRASTDPVLHEAAGLLVPRALGWPRRPLHGDAHTGNLLTTPDGPCWIDFEDVCVGPVEWDLASTTVSAEAVAAYPGEVDHDLLEDCRDLRRLQILASVLVDDLQAPELYGELTTALRRRLG